MYRSLARASSSAFDGFLIPPRTTFGILASAGNACFTLLTRQGERDAFVAACNDGLINPPVLGQANFGMAMMLALYNDINSPLFKKHEFSIDNFVEGAKPALERFHDIQISLQEDLHSDSDDGDSGGGEKEAKSEESSVEDTDRVPQASETVNGESSAEPSPKKSSDDVDAEAIFKALNGIKVPGSTDDDGGMMRLMKRSWAKDAEADSDSEAAQLRDMVTREYFDAIELSSKTNCLLEKKLNFKAGSGEITNMALLSARAMELAPEETETGNEDMRDDAGPMSDDSFNDERHVDHPVAAQVEVLYDIEQTFTAKEGDAEAEEAMKAQGLIGPRKSVLVGVFEGFLHKDPEGHDSIRWKLALNRPAWEFPYILSG